MKKVLLVVSLISVLLLAGCNKNEEINSNVNSNVPEIVTDNQQQEIIENDEIVEDIPNIKQDLITLAYSDDGVSIPKIDIDSEDALKVNEELNDMIETAKLQKKEYGSAQEKRSYRYSVTSNVLSLLIESIEPEADGYKFYNVYNFDINTGKLLKNIEVMGKDNAYVLMNNLKDIYTEKFNEIYGMNDGFPKDMYDKLYEEQLELIPTDLEDIPYFIDSEKGSQIVIKIISQAGPAYHYHVVSVK